MNTEHFTRISRITLNRQFSFLTFSTPVSQPWRYSRTQYFTDSFHHYATHFAVPMNTRYPLYAHSPAVRRLDCPILVCFRSYIALSTFPEHSTVFQAALDNPTIFCHFLVREGSGHDVTGVAGRHANRRCCSPLEYEYKSQRRNLRKCRLD